VPLELQIATCDYSPCAAPKKINKVNGTQTAPSYSAPIKPRGIVVANPPHVNYLSDHGIEPRNPFVKSSQRPLAHIN
jgi:hypothetical protein